MAVATAQYFGIVGNGRLHVVDRDRSSAGLREVCWCVMRCGSVTETGVMMVMMCGGVWSGGGGVTESCD